MCLRMYLGSSQVHCCCELPWLGVRASTAMALAACVLGTAVAGVGWFGWRYAWTRRASAPCEVPLKSCGMVEHGLVDALDAWLQSDNGDVDLSYGMGRSSLLTLAVYYAQEDIIALLLQRGAYVDSVGFQGHTPLSVALSKRRLDIADTLLESGADINLASQCPAQIAKQKFGEHVSSVTTHPLRSSAVTLSLQGLWRGSRACEWIEDLVVAGCWHQRHDPEASGQRGHSSAAQPPPNWSLHAHPECRTRSWAHSTTPFGSRAKRGLIAITIDCALHIGEVDRERVLPERAWSASHPVVWWRVTYRPAHPHAPHVCKQVSKDGIPGTWPDSGASLMIRGAKRRTLQ